jgi:hypothetical protein
VDAGTTGVRSVVRDSTNTFDIDWVGVLSGLMTGDLDTGSESSDTWYAVHVLADSTGVNAPKLLFSLSPTAPTLPGTHNKFRRIGWVRNNGSSQFVPFNQLVMGSVRRYHPDLSVPDRRILQNGQATAYAAVDASAFIPPGTRNFTAEVGFASGTAGAQGDTVKIRFPGHTGGSLFRSRAGVVSGQKMFVTAEIPVDTNRQFEYEVDQGGANENVVDFAMVSYDDKL